MKREERSYCYWYIICKVKVKKRKLAVSCCVPLQSP